MRLPLLPKGKSAVQVFGDHLGYLFRCTKNFIIDTHANGSSLPLEGPTSRNALLNSLNLLASVPEGATTREARMGARPRTGPDLSRERKHRAPHRYKIVPTLLMWHVIVMQSHVWTSASYG